MTRHQTDPQAPALAPDPGVTLEALLVRFRERQETFARAVRLARERGDEQDGLLSAHGANDWKLAADELEAALARRASLPTQSNLSDNDIARAFDALIGEIEAAGDEQKPTPWMKQAWHRRLTWLRWLKELKRALAASRSIPAPTPGVDR